MKFSNLETASLNYWLSVSIIAQNIKKRSNFFKNINSGRFSWIKLQFDFLMNYKIINVYSI